MNKRTKPHIWRPVWLERFSVCFAPSSNEIVDHKSEESADKIAAGGPWRVRDFLSFVQKTHQKGDVADVSQICPIMSFAQKALGTCRADEAPVTLHHGSETNLVSK
jgi:hypothetical protein